MTRQATKRRDSYDLSEEVPDGITPEDLGLKDRSTYRKSDLWKLLIHERLTTRNQSGLILELRAQVKKVERLLSIAVSLGVAVLATAIAMWKSSQ